MRLEVTKNLRGFRLEEARTYGPAGPVKQYTPEEIREYERKMNDK